jgi:hypothetical protein
MQVFLEEAGGRAVLLPGVVVASTEVTEGMAVMDDGDHPRVTYRVVGVDREGGQVVRVYVIEERVWVKH